VHGSATFFGKQVAAGVGCSGYAFGFTYMMLKLIDLLTPMSVGGRVRGRGSTRRCTVSADHAGIGDQHAEASKPVRSGSPRLGRFDSCAAPLEETPA
jgi:hypothetical protein